MGRNLSILFYFMVGCAVILLLVQILWLPIAFLFGFSTRWFFFTALLYPFKLLYLFPLFLSIFGWMGGWALWIAIGILTLAWRHIGIVTYAANCFLAGCTFFILYDGMIRRGQLNSYYTDSVLFKFVRYSLSDKRKEENESLTEYTNKRIVEIAASYPMARNMMLCLILGCWIFPALMDAYPLSIFGIHIFHPFPWRVSFTLVMFNIIMEVTRVVMQVRAEIRGDRDADNRWHNGFEMFIPLSSGLVILNFCIIPIAGKIIINTMRLLF